jgi:hypothetical protein
MFLPIPGYKPECQPDPVQKVIECQFGFAGGSSGFYLFGTASDASAFHYVVKLTEELPGTNQWMGAANGRDLVFEWDEIVTRVDPNTDPLVRGYSGQDYGPPPFLSMFSSHVSLWLVVVPLLLLALMINRGYRLWRGRGSASKSRQPGRGAGGV